MCTIFVDHIELLLPPRPGSIRASNVAAPIMLSRLKKFFGTRIDSSAPVEQTLKLNLPLEPTPENAPALAEKLVATVHKLDGISLDYSVGSLATLDSRILAFRQQGATSVQMPETLFMFGCYFGEVLVRNLGGRWFTPAQNAATLAVLAVELDAGLQANPIGKVFKLLENGPEDSTAWLYRVLAEEKSKRASSPGPA